MTNTAALITALLLTACTPQAANPDPSVSHSTAADACWTFRAHVNNGAKRTVGQEITAWRGIHDTATASGNQPLAAASAEVLAGLTDLNDARAAGGVRQMDAECKQLGV